ncbi:type II CRISPR-associated endonuclease Cas1 [Nemorincola caseinilytica]|uniref:CRISPR-associated endonuclease Cas1 n=1 Tax=Nemorincola caseinilytica TaxID=2054315 RepID=A0ABP8N642_9BACT
MIKRTLYFGNPAYLRTANEQLVVEFPVPAGTEDIVKPKPHLAPIEDIGLLILDHQQITISQALVTKLLANNTAIITCDNTHHPTGMMLNLDGHTLQSRIFAAQIDASEPLKKQLWQQTIVAKIQNQAAVLSLVKNSGSLFGEPDRYLLNLARDVKSGDSENMEAQAANYYWKRIFAFAPQFTRDRYGDPPNDLLNYGYAILRAVVARCLTGSGLLPTLGIHHRNQYNAYCLADDIMEPYRPYVDKVVFEIAEKHCQFSGTCETLELTKEIKGQLLAIPAMDVRIARSVTAKDTERSPLMVAVEKTTASLARCYEGNARKLLYPVMATE